VVPTSVQLWERIHAAGLATTEECRQWAIAISQAGAPERLQDPTSLVSELIRLGKITPFQANVLFHGMAIPLSIGPYRLESSLEQELGKHWFEVVEKNLSESVHQWMYLLVPESFRESDKREYPPSLGLAEKHVHVSHPSLDKWSFAGVSNIYVVAVCSPVGGRSLASSLLHKPMSWNETAVMMEQVAAGLQKLHDAGLVHGRISAESVWYVEDGAYVLRRDPLFPVSNPYVAKGTTIFGDNYEELLSVSAPELTLPGAIHTVQTDLYALGCLWYRALHATKLFGDKVDGSTQSWARAHSLESIESCVSESKQNRLQRCLAHLLAKNPKSRFATASDLIKAIEFALSVPVPVAVPQPEQADAPVVAVLVCDPVTEVTAKAVKDSPKDEPQPLPDRAQPLPERAKPLPEQTRPLPEQTRPLPGATQSLPNVLQKSAAAKKSGNKNDGAKKGGAKTTKKKKSKKSRPVWLLPSMVGGAGIVFAVLIFALTQNGRSTNPSKGQTIVVVDKSGIPEKTGDGSKSQLPSGASIGENAKTQGSKPLDPIAEYFSVVADDGKLLWAPPQAGSPYSLELLPAGLEGIVFVSGKVWHMQGEFANLGKWWLASQPALTKAFESYPMLSDDRIESVAIGLYPSKQSGVPQALFRLNLKATTSIDSIAKELPNFSMQLFDSKGSRKQGLWSNEANSDAVAVAMDELQTDGSAMIKRLTIGPQELVATLAELNGGAAPLRRQLETLLLSTDSRADISFLFAPSFLVGDARELLAAVPSGQALLNASIDETMQAVLLTTTLEPRWYTELRMIGSETRDAGKFALSLKQKLEKLPDEVESGMLNTTIHPYWRALSMRYPQMLRSLNKYGRFGIEDGQVVANLYLPSDAVSNLAVTSWMAMKFPVGTSNPSMQTSTKPAVKPQSKTIDEILDSKISVAFEQESLESGLQLISGEVADSVLSGAPISMAINFSAFKKGGITQNQQIRAFKQTAIPLRTILTDLVRRANPVTTVQSPTELDQKVVWVILDDAENPIKKKIELTTRFWAEENKAALPSEFIAE
jgi:serine/threonine protein kinase